MLFLYSPVEVLLDKGVIAVVPIPGKMTAPTTWRCVVLDESKGKDMVYDHGNGIHTRVKDLDGQVLQFLNDNKYLQAKKLQLADVTEKVEAKRFWPSEGAYLHKSTLKTLARCLSLTSVNPNTSEYLARSSPIMPQGTGTLTSDKGRVLGQFEVEGSQYIFVGNLTGFGQSFSIPNADITYDSADQLHKESEEFEKLPIEKDQIELKLKNGVAITGGFDMPFSDGEVKKGTVVGGGGKWLKL